MLMEKDWFVEMDTVNYETYDTDAEYDDMDGTSAAQKVTTTVCRWYHFALIILGQCVWCNTPAANRECKERQ